MVKMLSYCPHCKNITENKESPPPLVQKLIEEGVDTWIDTKLCLDCFKVK
jgi:hypothetical protein